MAQSVEVTPKRSKERGGRSQRLQGQSPQNESETKSPVDFGQPKAVGTSEGFWAVELACLIQRERTSEVFW